MIKLLNFIFKTDYNLSKQEQYLLESYLLINLCYELRSFYLEKCDFKGDDMQDAILLKKIVTDILQTEEYSLAGIAYYTGFPPDIITNLLIEKNLYPSFFLVRKLIELHSSIRPELYKALIKKIMNVLKG